MFRISDQKHPVASTTLTSHFQTPGSGDVRVCAVLIPNHELSIEPAMYVEVFPGNIPVDWSGARLAVPTTRLNVKLEGRSSLVVLGSMLGDIALDTECTAFCTGVSGRGPSTARKAIGTVRVVEAMGFTCVRRKELFAEKALVLARLVPVALEPRWTLSMVLIMSLDRVDLPQVVPM